MTLKWDPNETLPFEKPGPMGWARVVMRGGAIVIVLLTGVILMALIRLIERPIYGAGRPITPGITVTVCRMALFLMGMRYESTGEPIKTAGAVVANHSSWLDIFVLNARKRVYFVSKAEVAKWPGIGLLAKITGTVFISRDRSHAKAQRDLFEERLNAGHRLLFFPEGTSTDSLRVLPFKSTLFEAFFTDHLRDKLQIQPVTVIYEAPANHDPRFYGWWGDMEFGGHLLQVLATPIQGKVRVVYHSPVKVEDFPNRKMLARDLELTVRAGMPADRQIT